MIYIYCPILLVVVQEVEAEVVEEEALLHKHLLSDE
jgi:hypothetical protein